MRGLIPLALIMVSASCSDADRPAAIVTDSAGIRVVDNPGSGAWSEDERWVSRTLLRIGQEGVPEYEFGDVAGIAVDHEGRIYVLDDLGQHVRVFDDEGTYVRTIGSRGNGPGELNGGAWIWIRGRDTLMVMDMGNQRVNRYLLDGSSAGDVRVEFAEGIPVDWAVDDAGRIMHGVIPLADDAPGYNVVVVRVADWTVTDTLGTYPAADEFDFDERGPRLTVFAPQGLWVPAPNGGILTALTSEYRVTRFDASGTPELIIRRPVVPKAIGPLARRFYERAMIRLWEGRLPPRFHNALRRNTSFAEFFPVLTSIRSGPQGTIWVQRFQDISSVWGGGEEVAFDPERDIGAPEWDVFAAEGEYLGVVTLPSRFTPYVFVGERIYGVQLDEVDVQHVTTLQLVRADGDPLR